MKIIDSYIFGKVFRINIIIIIGLIVLSTFNRFLFFLTRAISNDIPKEVIVALTINNLPEFVGTVLLLTILLGVVATYKKLAATQQITVIHSLGFSRHRLLLSFLLPTMPFLIISFILLSYFSPLGLSKVNKIIEQTRNNPQYLLRTYQNYSENNISFGFEKLAKNKLVQPFFLEKSLNNNVAIYAETAILEQKDNNYNLKFNNGQLMLLDSDKNQLSTGDFKVLEYTIFLPPLTLLTKFPEAKTKPLLAILQADNINDTEQRIIMWLLSIPITVLILLVFTLGLCKNQQRSNSNLVYFYVIIAALAYIQLLITGRDKTAMLAETYFASLHCFALIIALISYFNVEIGIKLKKLRLLLRDLCIILRKVFK